VVAKQTAVTQPGQKFISLAQLKLSTSPVGKLPPEIMISVAEHLDLSSRRTMRLVGRNMKTAAEATIAHLTIRYAAELDRLKRDGSFPACRQLTLTGTIETRAPDFASESLKDLPRSVRRLNLHNVSASLVDGLEHLDKSSVTSLRLKLIAGRLGAGGARPLGKIRKYTELELINTGIGDEGLGAVLQNRALAVLHVPYNEISWRGVSLLEGMDKLIDLDLSGNEIRNERGNGRGNMGLDPLVALPRLSRVALCNCEITDDDVLKLLRIPTLTSVNLSNNPVSDEGAKALATLPAVSDVSLNCCNVTRKGVEALLGNPSIRTLHLACNVGIDLQDQKALQELGQATNRMIAFTEPRAY
jgi:Leucine-rich repeat (LRR) protein